MIILDIYTAMCWHEASYSIIEDALVVIAKNYPDTPLNEVIQAVAIGKVNATATRAQMKLDAKKILED